MGPQIYFLRARLHCRPVLFCNTIPSVIYLPPHILLIWQLSAMFCTVISRSWGRKLTKTLQSVKNKITACILHFIHLNWIWKMHWDIIAYIYSLKQGDFHGCPFVIMRLWIWEPLKTLQIRSNQLSPTLTFPNDVINCTWIVMIIIVEVESLPCL